MELDEGALTPNQEAFHLLGGFASGNVRMEGDVIQHLLIVKGNQTIGASLQELPWYTTSPKKKKTDGSFIIPRKLK